jgi:hypothetical protein
MTSTSSKTPEQNGSDMGRTNVAIDNGLHQQFSLIVAHLPKKKFPNLRCATQVAITDFCRKHRRRAAKAATESLCPRST